MRKPIIRIVILSAILLAGLAAVLISDHYRSANKEGTSIRGQLLSIGLKQSREVVHVTFPGTTISETLVQNRAYVISVPDDPVVPTLTLDQAILLSGDSTQPVNFIGYKYVSADGATEAAHRDDPNFLSRFPGQFFASTQARAEDTQYGNIISQFEQSHGITMGSTGVGGVSLERNSRYIVIVNESQPVTFNIRNTAAVCGDGIKAGTEACDDHNTTPGDGCSSTCQTESGWTCTGTNTSTCTTICGDGLKIGTEACDDHNLINGDGCHDTCTVESGWTCTGSPSVCTATPVCGNGIKEGTEACDDHNTSSGDGCSASCAVEFGWSCTGTNPSTCTTTCGDGQKAGTEACDDHNLTNGDGCSGTCTVESGWTCTGTNPSVCTQNSADLAISAYFDPATAQRGNNTVLHISVTNSGSAAATNTVVPLPAPVGLTFQTYDSTTGVSCSGGNCNFGTMASGQSKSFTITYLVNTITPCYQSASITANTSVSSGTTDADSSDNQAQATVTATCPPSADLSSTVTATPQTALQGTDITITTTLTNNGPATAVNPYFYLDVGGSSEMNSIRIQSGCTSFDTTTSGIKCYVSNLASGANQTAVVLAATAVHTPCTEGSIATHYVNIYPGSNTPDNNTANDHSSVTVTATCPVLNPDLALTMSASPSSVERGNTSVLHITVMNNGQGNAANTQLNFPVPSSLTYVSYSSSSATCTFSNNTLTCMYGTIPANTSVSRDVNVTVLVPTISPCTTWQDITASANVSTDSSDSDMGNNYATTTIGATCPMLFFSPAPIVDISGLNNGLNVGVELIPPSNILQTSPSQSLSIPITVRAGPSGPPGPGSSPPPGPVFVNFILTFSPELTFTGVSGGTTLQCMSYTNPSIPGALRCQAHFSPEGGFLQTNLNFTLPPICIADRYDMFLDLRPNWDLRVDYSKNVSCSPPQ